MVLDRVRAAAIGANKLVGCVDGERSQEKGVDEAEDREVRTDANRER